MSIEAKVLLTGRKLTSSLKILEYCGTMAVPSPAATRATTPAEVLAVAAISGAKPIGKVERGTGKTRLIF